MPAAERVCGRVLSLPMHPFLTDEQMERVAGTVKKAVADE
jgi:dTDP-4-amino-4,6-dideoxygalactose transaminase